MSWRGKINGRFGATSFPTRESCKGCLALRPRLKTKAAKSATCLSNVPATLTCQSISAGSCFNFRPWQERSGLAKEPFRARSGKYGIFLHRSESKQDSARLTAKQFNKLHLPHRQKPQDDTASPSPPPIDAAHDAVEQSDKQFLSSEGRKLSADSKFEWQRRHSSASSATLTNDRRPSPHNRHSSQTSSDSSSMLNPDSIGLHLVHDPEIDPTLDIIFLHGLGGGCRRSWSWDRNPDFFWPGIWLPHDQDASRCRIFTYGYNANFKSGRRSIATVTDFAKALLFDLGFGHDHVGKDLGIGKAPILFVAHSMGGLVVKKAFLLGQYDDTYRDLIQSIQGVIFLSTPHRGTQLADSLRKILTVTLRSPKDFISDLSAGSHTLEDLNEQFRHVGRRLSIVSFYETLATEIGFSKIMVLDRESSVLGYSGEVSASLDADHHNVCKFRSPTDPSYLKVLSAIKSLINQLGKPGSEGTEQQDATLSDDEDIPVDVRKLLRVLSDSENDLSAHLEKWSPGTCEWFLSEPQIHSWLERPSESHLVWYTAPPGSGKSVLASRMIDYLSNKGVPCQYFFFRAGDQTQRSVADMLRSIACQAAEAFPAFRKELAHVLSAGIAVEKGDATMVWRTLFQDLLLRTSFDQPLFWIIDALDECESPKTLFELFRSIPRSNPSIHVLITSRRMETLFRVYHRLCRQLKADTVDKEADDHNVKDIRLYAESELEHFHGTEELKERVLNSILDRAGGNFLWVKLVLEEIQFCHTESDIIEALDEIPEDMNDLYARMERTLLSNNRGDFRLAKSLLQWALCAPRSMSLDELNHALAVDFPGILDLKRTVREACGQFILVDRENRVVLLHKTARDYLINYGSLIVIEQSEAHTKLLIRSLSVLNDPKLKSDLTQKQLGLVRTKPFTIYAAETWAVHLRSVEAASDPVLDALIGFFQQNAVFSWIHLLALTGRLEIVVKSAKSVGRFVSGFRKENASRNPMLHRLSELESLELWMTDLLRLVGKFSRHLRTDPLCLYKVVPAMCPESSIFRQQFYRSGLTEILVSTADKTWNDNLARLALSNEEQPWRLACAGNHIALLTLGGIVHVWTSSDFRQVCRVKHAENATAMCMDIQGEKLAVYGLSTTSIWALPSGVQVCAVQNPASSRALTLMFTDDTRKLLSACDDRTVRHLELDDLETGWQDFDRGLLREQEGDGTFVNSPKWIEFSPDGTQLGVCYRGFPLSVWSLDSFCLISRCRRIRSSGQGGDNATTWFAVDQFTWNPTSGHIIGLYKDGCIFKWHPSEDDYQEVQSSADEVTCSRDGRLFATSNSQGTIKVWSFNYFSPIYQLASEDLVSGLIFSPDGTRLYDLRGSVVNVWEPNGLLRFAEAEEPTSDISSDVLSEELQSTLLSATSEATVLEFEPISAVALAPSQKLCAIGNDLGTISLFNLSTRLAVVIATFYNFMPIRHIAWSFDGEFLAVADLGGDAIILRVEPERVEGNNSTVAQEIQRPKLQLEQKTIHQILFAPDNLQLLVICNRTLHVWDIMDSTTKFCRPVEDAASRSWSSLSKDNKYLMGVGPRDVLILSWQDLTLVTSLRISESRGGRPNISIMTLHDSEGDQSKESSNDSASKGTLYIAKQSATSSDSRYLLFQLLKRTFWGQITMRPLILQADELDSPSTTQSSLSSLFIPETVISQIQRPLGIIQGTRLIFFDKDLWLCSYSLLSNPRQTSVKRHYFIPQDWTSTDGLQHCCLLKDGTLLTPRNGDVVIITSKFGSLDF